MCSTVKEKKSERLKFVWLDLNFRSFCKTDKWYEINNLHRSVIGFVIQKVNLLRKFADVHTYPNKFDRPFYMSCSFL